MKNNLKLNKIRLNAFTLIELLAVIIVLAIIALIATPIIFNVIENAKLKALENSCYGVIDAVRTQYAENLLNSENGKVTLSGDVDDLTLSGEHPYYGTWEIDNLSTSTERGIKIQNVKFKSMKNYTCSNVDSNGLITNKINCIKDAIDEVNPTITPKQATVNVYKGTNKKIKKYFDITFGTTGGEVICDTVNVNSLEIGNHTVNCTAIGTNGKTAESSITLTVEEAILPLSVDNSGANKPTLYSNMIPIVYDGRKWIYSNGTQTDWYNYTNKQWANAVVLNSGITKEIGDEVTNSDIALWYVWIPRYKYTIFNGNNESVNEQLINVTFESGAASTGTVTCINNTDGSETCTDNTNGSITNGTSTYTHPAFTFGNTNLKGFWVGKFEVSGSASTITIKPNVSSLRNKTISAFFTAIQNIKTTYEITNADSHMMKNMEWGAVAYLKQSEYGLGTTDIGINNNSSYTTGCGAVAGSSNSSTCNAYNTTDGMKASTTGNIYGVYDMSGGAWEYVMGNQLNESNEFYSSRAGFSSTLDSKYYDSYKYNSGNKTHARGKLGDATKETLKTFGSTSGGWYSNYADFPYSGHSWFGRGGYYGYGSRSGVFDFYNTYGSGYSDSSTRAVLSAQ